MKTFKKIVLGLLVGLGNGMNTWSMENGHNKNVDQPTTDNTKSSKDPVDENPQPSSSHVKIPAQAEAPLEGNQELRLVEHFVNWFRNIPFRQTNDRDTVERLVREFQRTKKIVFSICSPAFKGGIRLINAMAERAQCGVHLLDLSRIKTVEDVAALNNKVAHIGENNFVAVYYTRRYHAAPFKALMQKLLQLQHNQSNIAIIFIEENIPQLHGLQARLRALMPNLHLTENNTLFLNDINTHIADLDLHTCINFNLCLSFEILDQMYDFSMELGRRASNFIRPLILCGPEGTGKKSLIKWVQHETSNKDYKFMRYSIDEIINAYHQDSNSLNSFFNYLKIEHEEPTIIYLEGLELFNRDNSRDGETIRRELWRKIEECSSEQNARQLIFVLSALSSAELCQRTKRNYSNRIIEVAPPNEYARNQIIEEFLKKLNWNFCNGDLNRCVALTKDWLPQELKNAIISAVEIEQQVLRNYVNENEDVRSLDIQDTYIQELCLIRSIEEKNRIRLGQDQLLTSLSLAELNLSDRIRQSANAYIGIARGDHNEEHVIRSVFFTGPYGVGKTTLAQVIAREAGCKYIEILATRIVEQYQGTGAKRIEQLFIQAMNHSGPTLILIDEMEGLASRQRAGQEGTDDYEAAARTLGTYMNRCAESYPNIFVVLACNDKTRIPRRLQSVTQTELKFDIPKGQQQEQLLQRVAQNKGLAISPAAAKTVIDAIAERTVWEFVSWCDKHKFTARDFDRLLRVVVTANPGVRELTAAMIIAELGPIKELAKAAHHEPGYFERHPQTGAVIIGGLATTIGGLILKKAFDSRGGDKTSTTHNYYSVSF